MYEVQIRHDGLGQLYFVVVGPKVPAINEFRVREDAEGWVADRKRRDKVNARSRLAAGGRRAAMSSVGMVRTRHGWE